MDLEENGEENGDISVDLNIDSELDKTMAKVDGESANGITNNGNVDVEAVDEKASSSGTIDALNDSAHSKVETANDENANGSEVNNDTKPVASAESTPIAKVATNFIHQACYETISNDSVDNVELDLSLNRAKDIDDEDIEAAQEVSNDKEDANKDTVEPPLVEETNLTVEDNKTDKDEESPAVAVPAENPTSENEKEIANEVGNDAAEEEASNKIETPTSSGDLETESSNGSESERGAGEAAPYEEDPLDNEVALPAEPEVEEKAAVGESSELEIAAQPTAEASSPTKSASGSNKPL